MLKIAIIVLNWKQPQLTIDTVNSLLKIKHSSFSFHLYIVDNGSPDDSVKLFSAKYQNNDLISIISTDKNLGYVGGNNFGIKEAFKKDFDYILLTNNDVIFNSNFLEELLKITSKNPKIGIAGPKIYFAPGHEFHKNRYSSKELGKVIWSAGGRIDWNNIIGSNIGVDEVDHGQLDKINSDVDFISGCVMLVKTSLLKKIGLFDEKFFMYLEDADFCQRAKASGYQLVYIPTSKVWHINAGSSKSGGSLHDYFLTRNRLLFAFKYASSRTKFAVFRESIRKLFGSTVLWQKKGIVDFYFKKFGKGSWQ